MTRRIDRIIAFFISGNHSKSTQRKFVEWLSSDIDEEAKDEALNNVWQESTYGDRQQTSRSYRRFKNAMLSNNGLRTRSIYQVFMRYAAILLIPGLSIAFSYMYVRQHTSSEVEVLEYYAQKGENKHIILPDNSEITLNPGSMLLVPKNLSQTACRKVYLVGNASFSVTKDKKHPFVVKARDLNIEVLGTEFNVSAYPDDNIQTATLKSGSVKVYVDGQEDKPHYLVPNKQLRYYTDSKQMMSMDVDVENVYAWNDGHLVFIEQPISEIAKTLERRFNVRIYLTSGRYADEKITVKFMKDEKIEDVLSILSSVVSTIQYKIADDVVYIY